MPTFVLCLTEGPETVKVTVMWQLIVFHEEVQREWEELTA
jgi:hypothetical protein